MIWCLNIISELVKWWHRFTSSESFRLYCILIPLLFSSDPHPVHPHNLWTPPCHPVISLTTVTIYCRVVCRDLSGYCPKPLNFMTVFFLENTKQPSLLTVHWASEQYITRYKCIYSLKCNICPATYTQPCKYSTLAQPLLLTIPQSPLCSYCSLYWICTLQHLMDQKFIFYWFYLLEVSQL